jgi:putative hemolysin
MHEAGYQSHRLDGSAVKLIDVEGLGQSPFQRKLLGYLSTPIEKALCIDDLNDTYSRVIDDQASQTNFFHSALAALDISVNLATQDLRNIPLQGPTVVTANHPFGGLDGIVLASVVTALRPDVKILGNYLLARIPELEGWLIPVDPFRGDHSVRFNIAPLRKAIAWVKEGGMLLVFPGREISHFRLTDYSILDSEWSPSIGAIIRHARATVLPVYFTGLNSWTFQLLGLVHPLMRTALLPRELNSKRSSTVEIRIGKRIPWTRVSAFGNNEDLLNHVRQHTYIMANRAPLGAFAEVQVAAHRELTVVQEPIIPPTAPLILRSEVAELPANQKLVQSGQYSAYYATADQIPGLMREIGRQREITFREADEGTGRALDLDHFDGHYTHLFLWHATDNELVGAYRLGLVPEILKRFGREGLYTNLLFQYEPQLWDRWDHAIELGRAFIQPKYQKQVPPLSMLWRGICQFIVKNPEFKTLFGPLSISRAYNQASKSLIELYIREQMFDRELSRFVKARNPFRPSSLVGVRPKSLSRAIGDLDDVSALVSSIESDGKGIPVLFRQYSKFDFRVLGFNVNRYFSNTVDGLMYVDLPAVKARVLHRYMGEAGYAAYADYHKLAGYRLA